MRAWHARGSFRQGTNLKAWIYKILRNSMYTEWNRQRRLEQDVDGRLAASLPCAAEQEWRLEFNELREAIGELAPLTREAVLLIHVAGLSYEEAAQVCGCAVGTMKSRASRGCERLAELTDNDRRERRTSTHAAPVS